MPLLFCAPTRAQYRLTAAELPRATEWTDHEQIWELFDALGVPIYSRKGNLPRLILCAAMDRAETDGVRLAPLRPRRPLQSGARSHFALLLWTYMGMLIKDPLPAAGQKKKKRAVHLLEIKRHSSET